MQKADPAIPYQNSFFFPKSHTFQTQIPKQSKDLAAGKMFYSGPLGTRLQGIRVNAMGQKDAT